VLRTSAQLEKGMHASGHASGPEILEAIREIEPEKVYPIHTENKKKNSKH